MATTEVSISNGALIKLGAERVLTLDDNATRARLVKESYPKMRDLLLRSHPWHFNKAYASLAQITKSDDIWDFGYLYQLPSDCARVFETDSCGARWEELENGTLAADVSTIKIKYGKKITDCTYFDAAFVETLEWAIAADIAYALTQSTAQADAAKEKMEFQLRQTRSFSAQVGTPQQVTANKWLNARRGYR